MIKKQILSILAVMFVMSLFVMTASAEGIGNGNGSECAIIGIGDGSGYVTLPITVTGAENIGSCDVTISYDASIATVVSVSNGHMDSMFSNMENAGEVRVGAYQTNNPGLPAIDGEEFVIAHVNFESVASSGSCPLEIIVTTFKDATPTGNPKCYNISNGVYTATGSNGNGGDNGYDNGDDNGDNGNETPTVTPTIKPTTEPTPSPTQNLPHEDPLSDPSFWTVVNIVIIIAGLVIVIVYLIYRKKKVD